MYIFILSYSTCQFSNSLDKSSAFIWLKSYQEKYSLNALYSVESNRYFSILQFQNGETMYKKYIWNAYGYNNHGFNFSHNEKGLFRQRIAFLFWLQSIQNLFSLVCIIRIRFLFFCLECTWILWNQISILSFPLSSMLLNS